MDKTEILDRISRGRTDLVFDLLALPDWRTVLNGGRHTPLQWFVYYDDVTALKAVLSAGGDLASIDLDGELGHASFFGHWKVCDVLLAHGADAKRANPNTGETPLHNALCKAGRPHFSYVVRLLLEHGADPNAHTIAGAETGGFMRDAHAKGETPLHRAAAFADTDTIQLLLDHGADRTAQDVNGETPIGWASWHQRPGAILKLLAHGAHQISERSAANITSDHGAGWGNGMERNFLGDYLPESKP
jgi:ankyrin repeat protein